MEQRVAGDPRYPIGNFDPKGFRDRDENVRTIAALPEMLSTAVARLNDEQLDQTYRPGGWTLRQTVHHLADSHINSLCRFKLSLTENETPVIRPYFEERWAELADSSIPISPSLAIIDGVHRRWAALVESMTDEQFQREFIHPESGRWTLEKSLGFYTWHSLHHLAHISQTRTRHRW